MAVLQAWPGRGYWQGRSRQPGPAHGASMSQTSQPRALSALVSAFGSFDTAHGFAVNLFVVIALAAIGAALLTGRPRLVRAAVLAAGVLVPGRLGARPGLRLLRRPRHRPQQHDPDHPAAGGRVPGPHPAAGRGLSRKTRSRRRPAPAPAGDGGSQCGPKGAHAALAATTLQTVTALAALGVVVIGAAPMAAASVNRTADPILAQAIAGYSPPLDLPRPAFRLTDQRGRTVTLASLRGKVVLLTFLDPVCTTDCPLIAQEFKATGTLLGAQARQVELVAIVANPTYYGTQFTQAFDRQEGLTLSRAGST